MPLARLLAVAYRQLIDGLHRRLAEAGWEDVRPTYGFVLLALRDRERSVSELAGLLGVSKQATSKLLDQMAEGRCVTRAVSTDDARRRTVALAQRGHELLAAVEAIYADLEAEIRDPLDEGRVMARSRVVEVNVDETGAPIEWHPRHRELYEERLGVS